MINKEMLKRLQSGINDIEVVLEYLKSKEIKELERKARVKDKRKSVTCEETYEIPFKEEK